jgi:predicted amidohydrolase YtcJ
LLLSHTLSAWFALPKMEREADLEHTDPETCHPRPALRPIQEPDRHGNKTRCIPYPSNYCWSPKNRWWNFMKRKVKALVLLGAGLCLAGATHAQQADLSSPDLVLINGNVLTMDGRSSVVEALAVLDGKILATGSNASVKSIISTRTRVLDLAGRTVVPGLIDTHAHFKAAGLSEYVVNMSKAKTVVEALEAIKTFAAKKKPGEWIVGGAWHPPSQLAERRYLTKQEIDSVAPNNPVYLRTVGHFSMANGLALQKADVDKSTPNPSGGSFERDASGELTGVLVETAIDRVEKAVPPWTEDDEVRQFKIAEAALNTFGITSVIEGATEARDVRTLEKIALSGGATLRVGLSRSRQRICLRGKRSYPATAHRPGLVTTG